MAYVSLNGGVLGNTKFVCIMVKRTTFTVYLCILAPHCCHHARSGLVGSTYDRVYGPCDFCVKITKNCLYVDDVYIILFVYSFVP